MTESRMLDFAIYRGRHLGRNPVTRFDGKGVTWDSACKALPPDRAASIVRSSGFLAGFTFQDASRELGTTEAKLRELAAEGVLSVETFQASESAARKLRKQDSVPSSFEGGELEILVLDRSLQELRQILSPPKKPKSPKKKSSAPPPKSPKKKSTSDPTVPSPSGSDSSGTDTESESKGETGTESGSDQ